MKEEKYNIPCSKCNGKGKIQGFSMVAGGVCFQCKGDGYRKGTKKEYEKFIKMQEELKQANIREKQKKELENYLCDNAKYLKNDIKMVIRIKETEDIEKDNEALYVYNRQKKKIVEFLNKYKEYKNEYNKTLILVENILNEYKITCV